jgi:hypothetical protein
VLIPTAKLKTFVELQTIFANQKLSKKRVCEKYSKKKSCSILNVERNNCPKGVSCELRKVCQQQCKTVFDKYDAKRKMEFVADSLEELEDEEVTLSFE